MMYIHRTENLDPSCGPINMEQFYHTHFVTSILIGCDNKICNY